MKNILILSVFFLFGSSALFSQDIIHMKDDSQVKAIVKSVDKSNITYVRADNPEGAIYTVSSKKISKIVYKDGFIESFAGASQLYNQKKNVISINYGDLTQLRLAGSYERLFFDGNFGIKLPYSMSIQDNYNYYYGINVIAQTGLDLNLYPLGQRRLSFFTGVGTRMGQLERGNDYWYYDPYYPYYYDYYYPGTIDRLFFGVYVNNGLVMHITEHFSVSGQFGLGFRNEEGPGRMYSHTNGELNISLRF